MRIFLSFSFFLFGVFSLLSQDSQSEQEVKATIEKLFTAMRENDADILPTIFDEKITLEP